MNMMRSLYLTALVWLSVPVLASAQAPSGEVTFQKQCATCHADGAPESRAPKLDALRRRTPEAVIRVLLDGAMRIQGSRLSGLERRAVAEYVTGKTLGGDATGTLRGRCTTSTPFKLPSGTYWNGWGGTIANTRFQSAAEAGLSPAQVSKLKLKWAFGFPDASTAWAQPTVIGGRVFVGSQAGMVYSLDAKRGCVHWVFPAEGGVRTAMVLGPKPGGGSVVHFADTKANLYAIDATTGKQVWVRKVDDHTLVRVTGTPTLHDGRLYVGTSSYEEVQGGNPQYECCTFRGSITAVNAATGEIVWKTYTIPEAPTPRGKNSIGVQVYGPSGAAVWSPPTIDVKRGLLYVGTGNSYTGPPQANSNAILALDLKTGQIRWSSQMLPADVFIAGCKPGALPCPEQLGPDYDFGQPPMLVTRPSGGDLLVAGQKSGIAWGLDPDKSGAVVWQYRVGEGSMNGGMEWGSAVDNQNAYFPLSDSSRPKPGGLHAVSLDTGKPVWVAPPAQPKCGNVRGCNAAQPAAITVIPGVVFSGSVDGGIRAYSTKDGSMLWEYDTNREFETVNGVEANGAAINGPGPAVAGGMVYTNSGYGNLGGRPGNVLLAFGVD
jgi:polyvinyl alcohol dehydrogenase (cytochrome)